LVYLHAVTDRDAQLTRALALAMASPDAGGYGSRSSLHGQSRER